MGATEAVLTKFMDGDVEAISQLVDVYKTDLYNLCYRLTLNKHDADDLFQQTWMKVIKSSGKFVDIGFRSWLYRICINQYKDNYRRQKLKNKYFAENFDTGISKDYVLEISNPDGSAEEQYEKKSKREIIIAQINKLPQKQKMPIVLHYFQQMKYSEISEILRVPEGTVKSRINTAKRNLKNLLEGELND